MLQNVMILRDKKGSDKEIEIPYVIAFCLFDNCKKYFKDKIDINSNSTFCF
jgi:hypothetical protein